MAQAKDNEDDKFFDAKEHQQEPQQQQPLIKSRIIKKKNNQNQNKNYNINLADIGLQGNVQKQFTIKDNEYLEYKKQLFGKLNPDRTDNYCEFYLCNNIEQIKYFTKNIKEYALNTNISNEHITNIAKKIYKSKELYFVNPIAVIEYVNQNADTPKDLIEIVDGHHRLKVLQKLFAVYQYDDISFTFWVQVHKCKHSEDAVELFRKYNTVKPFQIDLDLTDFMILLIDKLNTHFNKKTFEFIKDTKQRANRPSFGKTEFRSILEIRLNEQINTVNDISDYSDINIENIINKFINYNTALLIETLQWFNQKHKTGKITENIYKKAKDNKCVLGLLPVEDVINACVCL